MEPSSKKRKLAPKVDTAPASSSQLTQHTQGASPSSYQHQSQVPPQFQPPPYTISDAAALERHDFESFARHLQDAAMLIQRKTESPPYVDVSVLLLSWEDDTAVYNDTLALEQLFQRHYNFSTSRWQIPRVSNPSIKLGVRLASFLDNARPNHLLIIYYAGHGFMSPDGQLYWASSTRSDAARLKWDGVRCLFEDAHADVLLLLDTCAMADIAPTGSHGAKQVIAARSPVDSSGGGMARSFTSHLIEALRRLANGTSFTSERLWQEILSIQEQQQHSPGSDHKVNGASPSPQLSQLPIILTLAPGNGHCLTLAPLTQRTPHVNGCNGAEGPTMLDSAHQSISPDSVADLRFDEARILVCTTFVGDASPTMNFFKQWLQEKPSLGTKIAVEGMFLGPPTMLLISMPLSVWNVVQQDKVCCFLGYITSHNMLHLYEKLVGSVNVQTMTRPFQQNHHFLEANELIVGNSIGNVSSEVESDPPAHDVAAEAGKMANGDGPEIRPLNSPSEPRQSSIGDVNAGDDGGSGGPVKSEHEVADSAEMQEAAEQLKALSHVGHQNDVALPAAKRPRTSLPDGLPKSGRNGGSRLSPKAGAGKADGAFAASGPAGIASATGSRTNKAARRSVPKQETRCNLCSHAPFKDSSSLRKHVAAAHTRPFPCAFSFAGCSSTFGSKNEWKRHIASQHLCLQYYRCSQCPQSTAEGKSNEFNRKDLFTQHLRRMHAPFQVKRAMSKGGSKLLAEWEEHVKDMQQSCLVTRRKPPQKSACPKPGCQHEFNGAASWDEWTEHVGRHMEKSEAEDLGVDSLLTQWALDEGIIEAKDDGAYRLCTNNGAATGGASNGSNGNGNGGGGGGGGSDEALTDGRDTGSLGSQPESCRSEDVSMTDAHDGSRLLIERDGC